MPKSFAHFLPRVIALALLALATQIALATPSLAAPGGQNFDCSKDVYFVGVPGSGENPNRDYSMGGTVERAANYVEGYLIPQERSMHKGAVNYPAHPALPDALTDSPKYFAGMNEGVAELQRILVAHSKVAECQHQRVILGGYSQGAMVIHRAIRQMVAAKQDEILKRIDAALLIADPDRVPYDNVIYIGGAPSSTHGLTQENPFQAKDTSKFSSTLRPKIISVCLPRDPICGLTKSIATVPISDYEIHQKYKEVAFNGTMWKAVESIRWAFPSDKITFDQSTAAVAGQVYVPLSHQFRATGGRNCVVTYSTTSVLPPGLFMNSSGLVTGTPTVAETVRASLRLSSKCHGIGNTTTAPVTLTIAKGPAAPVTHNGHNTGITAGTYIASVSPGAPYAELRKCMKVAGGGSCEIVKITAPTKIVIEKRWQVFYGQDLVLMPA